MNTVDYADVRVRVLGKLISTQDGRCSGPSYGEVYTAPKGQSGYIAGYRNKSCLGLGLMGREWHATMRAAQEAALRMTDN